MARKSNKPKHYRTVAEAMKALGYTDQRLADEVGCNRTWITLIRGGRKIVSLKMPIRICRALNVPIEALADQDGGVRLTF